MRSAASSGRDLSADRSGFHHTFALVVLLYAGGVAACRHEGKEEKGEGHIAVAAGVGTVGTPTATAAQIVAAIQAQPGSPVQAAVAQSARTVTGGLQAQFPAAAVAAVKKPATVVLPQAASGVMHLKDTSSGATVDISLSTALPVPAQIVGGYVVYPAALGSATILQRPIPEGTEDFIYFHG